MKYKKEVKQTDFKPPAHIEIITDGSEAKYINTVLGIHEYEYTKGEYKKGMRIKWDDAYLIKMLEYSFKIK